MKRRLSLLPILLLLSLNTAACLSDHSPQGEAGPPPTTVLKSKLAKADGVAQQTTAEERENDARDRTPATRKLIRSAEFTLEVSDYAKARQDLNDRLRALGGYVESAQVQHRNSAVSRAVLVIRVPSHQLSPFLEGTRGMGEVQHESIKTRDVTDQHIDTTARLANARKLEGRLLELAATKAHNVKSLLEVERELARIRESIERYEATLKNMDARIAMSSVTLSLNTRRVYRAAQKPTIGEQMANTLSKSFAGLVHLGYGALLSIVALLPWIPPIGLIFWLLRRVVRQRRLKRTATTSS